MRRVPGPVVALATAAIAAGSLAGAAEPKTGPGGSIGPGNVRVFATEFDRTFGAAMKPLFVRLASIHPAGGGQKRDVSLTLRGKTGTMRVAGYGLVLPAPARWDRIDAGREHHRSSSFAPRGSLSSGGMACGPSG